MYLKKMVHFKGQLLTDIIESVIVSVFYPRHDRIPYSRKIWRGIKFGSLAVCL